MKAKYRQGQRKYSPFYDPRRRIFRFHAQDKPQI